MGHFSKIFALFRITYKFSIARTPLTRFFGLFFLSPKNTVVLRGQISQTTLRAAATSNRRSYLVIPALNRSGCGFAFPNRPVRNFVGP